MRRTPKHPRPREFIGSVQHPVFGAWIGRGRGAAWGMPRNAWTEPSLRPDRTPLSTRASGNGLVGKAATPPTAGVRQETPVMVPIINARYRI